MDATPDRLPDRPGPRPFATGYKPHSGDMMVYGGGALTVVEGEWPHPRLVIIEFPSRAAAEGWYASDAYQAVIPLRLNSATGNFVIVDGPA